MNFLYLSIFLIFGSNCFAQEPVAAIESPDMNILYRGYSNRVIPAVTNNDGRKVGLESENATITAEENRGSFIVKPGNEKKCYIDVILSDSNGEIQVIKTIEYRVHNLPDPSIYWGGFREGRKGNVKGNNLFAKYPPEIPLNASFSVVNWTVTFEDNTISGVGGSLKPAEELFKSIKEEIVLNFTVYFVGPDGISRRKNVYWMVIPWEEEKDVNPKVFKCG